MAFHLVRRMSAVMLMVSACPEPVSWDMPPRRGPLAD